MKLYFIFIICLLFNLSLCGQDLVLTYSGDTLQCKILQVTKDYVIYSDSSGSIRKDSVRMTEVSSYYYSESLEDLLHPGRQKDFERLQFSLSPGVGYLLSKMTPVIPDEFHTFLNNSHYGFALNGNAALFFTPHWGFGFTGSYFYSYARNDMIMMIVDTVSLTGSLSSNLGLAYVAGGIHYRNASRESKRSYELSLCAGYLNYRDMIRLNEYKTLFTGGTIGGSVSVYVDFFLKRTMGIRTGLVFMLAEMDSYSRTDENGSKPVYLSHEDKMNLSRIDFVLGIRL